MPDCVDDGNVKVSVRIRAGWRHEWRRPPPNTKVYQVVPGPFKNSLPLVEDTPFYFVETKHFRTRHPRRKLLSPEMIAERRCAAIRTGIPDPWTDYMTFRGTPQDITKVSEEDKELWSSELDLTESVWKKHGIRLTQGIPNPWEFWPKFSGLDGGDNKCPCLEPKPLLENPCENPVSQVKDLDHVPQGGTSNEMPTEKTSKKKEHNLEARKEIKERKKEVNKTGASSGWWKKRQQKQPQNEEKPFFYEPQWEYESQPCKSCGFTEPKILPLAAKNCGCLKTQSQPAATKFCECPKHKPTQEHSSAVKQPLKHEKFRENIATVPVVANVCGCSEKQKPPPSAVPMPSPENFCGCPAKTKPLPVITKQSPAKSCTCSEKLKPPPQPPPPPPPPPLDLAMKSPAMGKMCTCLERPNPIQKPPNIVKPSPNKSCACPSKQKPTQLAPPPPVAIVMPSPENGCKCIEKQNPPPLVRNVAKPAKGRYCECSEKPKLPPVAAKSTADASCDCSDLPQNNPKMLTAGEVSAKSCGCSQLAPPLLRPTRPEVDPGTFCDCSQQAVSPKPPPPSRPPPPKCREWPASTLTHLPKDPSPMVENFCDFQEENSYLTPKKNKPSPEKSCGNDSRSCSKQRPEKTRTARETGYLQMTDSPVQQQEQVESVATKSTAIQCDSLKCIQGETAVVEVEPIDLQEKAEPASNWNEQQCPTCKTNLAEKDTRKLEELWKDYEKRKEVLSSFSAHGERNSLADPNQIVFDENNVDDGGEFNAPRRRGRMGSILKSASCDYPESDAPTKRVSISLPENEGNEFFSADEDDAKNSRRTGGHLPIRTSSGNISDVSSFARPSVAGSVTSETFLSRLNTATGASSKSDSVTHDTDEEVQLAAVNLDDIEPLTQNLSSEPSVESFFSRRTESHDTLSNHSVYSKRMDTDCFESPVEVKSQESESPMINSSSKFQPNSSRPSQESNTSVLSGLQAHMERIEELQNSFAAEDGRYERQWPEEGGSNNILGVGTSEPFSVSGIPTEIENGDRINYFQDAWESTPSETRATKDAEEPDQDIEEATSYYVPKSPSRRDRGSRRRLPSEKSHSTYIVGVPDLEPRHRRRCYACQMQEEDARLKALKSEKEDKKMTSSSKRPKSAASGKRERTPNYWFEKSEKGMAYYADEEAVVIADPRSINAKVSVIPKKQENKARLDSGGSSVKNQPGNSNQGKERRNRMLAEQEVYRPKHMGKPREYDYLGSTVQGQDSDRGFLRMGMSGSPETSCSDNVILSNNVTTSSTQNIYFGNEPFLSPQNSVFGNAVGSTPASSHSANATRPVVMQGYLDNGKCPNTQNRNQDNRTGRVTYYDTSNACDVCCKPSILNLVPNLGDLSNNRPLAESPEHRKEALLQRQVMHPDHSGRDQEYESGRDIMDPRAVQRKTLKKHERCNDNCNPKSCSRCESSDDLKTMRSNRVLSEQNAVRPPHFDQKREYEYLKKSGKISQHSKSKGQKSSDSSTRYKSSDYFDPHHEEKTSRMESDGLEKLGKRMSSLRRKHQKSPESCDICCKTSSRASTDGQQLAKYNKNKMLLQQEVVQSKHKGKTRDLPETALLGSALSQNKAPKQSHKFCEPKECSGPAYASNTFLVDPIQLIMPSTSRGRGQDCVGQSDSWKPGVAPTDVISGRSSKRAEDIDSMPNDSGRRSKDKGRKKNARSMFVSQPKRH